LGELTGNEYIKLSHTEKQDIPFVLEAEQRCENAKYIGQWTHEQHCNALNEPDILHLVIRNAAGEFVGYAIIKGLSSPNDSIELMRIVIEQMGCGYGKMTLSLIKRWCFEVQKAHRLWLDVWENNLRAQHVYESQGFKREGLLRECIKVGDAYQSLIVMSILNQEHRQGEVLL